MTVNGSMAIKFLKETNLTKIKDLVDVFVDAAIRVFPVDSERYELRANLNDDLNEVLNTPQFRLFQDQDPRVKALLDDLDSMIIEGFCAAVLHLRGVPLSARRNKLATRFLRSCRLAVGESVQSLDAVWLLKHRIILFGELFQRLQDPSQLSATSQQDRRFP
jgi:hypothetical protein